MENFAWCYPVLRRASRHHETGEPLPEALFEKLNASRHFGSALAMLRPGRKGFDIPMAPLRRTTGIVTLDLRHFAGISLSISARNLALSRIAGKPSMYLRDHSMC